MNPRRDPDKSWIEMAENYVIETTVEIDAEAYDDPMDALTYVNDLLNEGDDVLSVDTTMKEEPSE